jgi:ATP-dependent helicase/nuclease subunit B
MLHVVTGRFHPHLETALIEHVRSAKAAEPLAPVAVLVPSQSLVRHLVQVMALEHRLSLVNIHILTFHQLVLRLAAEAGNRPGGRPAISVVDGLFFEQLVRHLVRSRLPGLAPLQDIGHSSGTWAALWSTVRDLKDAGVAAADALQAVREGYFGQEDAAWLDALFTLHAAVQEAGTSLGVGTPDDLAQAVTPMVSESRWMARLRRTLYYGFYDLTQVQLSLLEAVAKTTSTTVFFPWDEHPSYRFARRFFDRAIRPLVPAAGQVVHLGAQPDAGPLFERRCAVTVQTVVGVEEELASVCRHILDLVETNGYAFEDIGVVARSLEPYASALSTVFAKHRIPVVTSAGRPLIQEPLTKTMLQLAALPLHDYYRGTMLDLLGSPLFQSRHYTGERDGRIRPDLWRLLIEELHITRGKEEWARLEEAGRTALAVERGEEDEPGWSVQVPAETIQLLSLVVTELITDTAAWPPQGSAAHMASAFRQVAAAHFCRPDDQGNEEHAQVSRVWAQLDAALETLAQLDALGDPVSWSEFVELLTHVCERMTLPLEPTPHRGVMVADAMATRGLSFKVLFLIGLNDHVFPRYIREDPFLRDRHRRVLEETLGSKIDEKLAGYDEEALLLALMQQAATDRLMLSTQRADEQGRTLTPSPYIDEAAALCGMERPPMDPVPRQLTDLVAQRPHTVRWLAPDHLVLWAGLNGVTAPALMAAAGRDPLWIEAGREAIASVEEERPLLGAWDGLTGELREHWSRLEARGLAPTPLERYARCPFQYFAGDVLRLEPLRRSSAPDIEPALLGTVCHAALRRCYELLVPMGWPAKPVTDDTIEWCVYSAVAYAAEIPEALHRTGPYLLWELAKDAIVEVISAAIESDEHAYQEEPFHPLAFEVDAEGCLPANVAGPAPIKIKGRVDRVDRLLRSNEIRIIDYKFKLGSAPSVDDRHLLQAAVRGTRLQPPLYAGLDFPESGRPAQVQLFFLAPRWPIPIVRATLESSAWTSAQGPLMADTFRLVIEGLRAGRYFILPDGYCDTCEFRVSCRRDHTPTWWRAYRAQDAKQLRALRAQKVRDE